MIRRVFVDSDVILDVALAREPFVTSSKMTLGVLENGLMMGFVSANGLANLYYVLRKAGGDAKARKFLGSLLKYLSVLPITHANVSDALASGFADLEDAMQYFCAQTNQCDAIITRNLADYRKSKIAIYTPTEFLGLLE
ncbi:MAG TPA: PIN domain-containing protein [Thermoflexales bacterium]|nr:PIN domain-containing protein [Thermoflexales bacterium]HQW34634.1 PIN domain-containing protein [Thermoflexales bacterium]HQX75529.1 PIN domain-containing protein [Thermoflexales bacterium]HQZ23125.1 PIN domain-containing protein [Thermoflexales bacterium]HRA01203.1 PIN domain-containing protein [Thermoflexales bacterium]